ncbi:MAG: alpha/beta fold hydrolase [Planctomycetota bacterium]|nr:MAG: alpha/beta fold hydrolase [Planctomycetota bacterium]
MPHVTSDGVSIYYETTGRGLPFLFQHGCGGDHTRAFDLVEGLLGIQVLAADARGHGRSELGPIDDFTFETLARDMLAVLNAEDVPFAFVGGISMGAAIAVRLALLAPDRVTALVLCRPCWLHEPDPPHARVFAEIGRLIASHGGPEAALRFRASPSYRAIAREAPDLAESLAGLCLQEGIERTAEKFVRIAPQTVVDDLAELRRIDVPTLVLATERDPVHPLRYGKLSAREIPDARLEIITPKPVDAARYRKEARNAISRFLEEYGISRE